MRIMQLSASELEGLDEISVSMDELMTSVVNLTETNKAAMELLQGMEEYSEAIYNSEAVGGRVLSGISGSVGAHKERLLYVLMNVEGNIQRFTTTDRGVISNVIVAPNAHYSIRTYNPIEKTMCRMSGRTAPNGQNMRIPYCLFSHTQFSVDSDGDGVPDVAERVVGTSPDVADTDGDGESDGAELEMGKNPLDNVPAQTGVIGVVPTNGLKVRSCASENVLALLGPNGVELYNIFNQMSPTVIGSMQLTQGMDVACAAAISSSPLIAVARGVHGVVVIDISDPSEMKIHRQVRLATWLSACSRFC